MAEKKEEVVPKIISKDDIETIQDLKALETEIQFDMFKFLGNSPYLDIPWVKALIVMSVCLLIAYFVRLLLFMVAKSITGRTKSNFDNQIVQKLKNPIFITIMFVGIFVSSLALNFSDETLVLIRKLLYTFTLLIWMVVAIRISKLILSNIAYSSARKKLISQQTLPLFLNFSGVLIIIIFIYMIMSLWNVNMTAFLASAGVMGVAIGFAAKDTLANLISGVLILADQPYRIGDFVVLESGERGEITHIGIRSTRMRTRDDVEVTVPNSIMGNTTITNESGGPYEKFRIRLPIGVAYGTELNRVREKLIEVAEANDNVCEDPEPRVRIRSFGASSLDFELLCWVPAPILRGKVLDELHESVYVEFKRAGLEIPFQQLDLHIKEKIE